MTDQSRTYGLEAMQRRHLVDGDFPTFEQVALADRSDLIRFAALAGVSFRAGTTNGNLRDKVAVGLIKTLRVIKDATEEY